MILSDKPRFGPGGNSEAFNAIYKGKTLLAPKYRGFATCVGTAFDQGLPESCADCGQCVEACPTGALDWRRKK